MSPTPKQGAAGGGPIDHGGALEIARAKVRELSVNHDFVLMEDQTEERHFGWVFFYTTRAYTQSRDPNDLVPGNAPLVVHRADGALRHLGTSVPPHRAIAIYEQIWEDENAR